MVKKQISKLLIISMQLIIFYSCERTAYRKVSGLTKDEVSKLIPKEINTDLWIFDKIIKKTNNSDIDSIKHKMSNLKISIRKDTTIINELLETLTDLPLKDNKPVRIIIEERLVKEETWEDPKIGTIKWTGIL